MASQVQHSVPQGRLKGYERGMGRKGAHNLSPPSAKFGVGPSAILIARVSLSVGSQVGARAAGRQVQTTLGGALVLTVAGGLHCLENLREVEGRGVIRICGVFLCPGAQRHGCLSVVLQFGLVALICLAHCPFLGIESQQVHRRVIGDRYSQEQKLPCFEREEEGNYLCQWFVVLVFWRVRCYHSTYWLKPLTLPISLSTELLVRVRTGSVFTLRTREIHTPAYERRWK